MTRRLAYPVREFYEHLERQLPEERPGDGSPSRVDFQTHELFEIVERFATGWDDLPSLSTPGMKILINADRSVYSYSVSARCSPTTPSP